VQEDAGAQARGVRIARPPRSEQTRAAQRGFRRAVAPGLEPGEIALEPVAAREGRLLYYVLARQRDENALAIFGRHRHSRHVQSAVLHPRVHVDELVPWLAHQLEQPVRHLLHVEDLVLHAQRRMAAARPTHVGLDVDEGDLRPAAARERRTRQQQRGQQRRAVQAQLRAWR
jgi:hypothetical protein